MVRLPLVLACILAVRGCGNSSEDDAQRSAGAFEAALRTLDWSSACGQLTPEAREALLPESGEACPTVLRDERLPVASGQGVVSVFGSRALVRFPEDAVFLSLLPEGWRVVAAGCTARRQRPYECQVDGG